MSKFGKVIDSRKQGFVDYPPIYWVTKASKYGTYTCSVSPCSEDIDNTNDWDGYRFAERKCDIKIMHAKAKILKERANGILNAHKALWIKYKSTKQYEEAPFLEDLYHQYEVAQKEYEKAYNQYKYMRDSFSDYTSRMIERRKKINEKVVKNRTLE